jgi:hypothetical protein
VGITRTLDHAGIPCRYFVRIVCTFDWCPLLDALGVHGLGPAFRAAGVPGLGYDVPLVLMARVPPFDRVGFIGWDLTFGPLGSWLGFHRLMIRRSTHWTA